MENGVMIGRFVKPFGIRGELKFVASDDFWPETLESQRLEMRWRDADGPQRGPALIKHYRPHTGHWVVTVGGVDDRNAAEAIVPCSVYIDPSNLDVAPPQSERPFQVIGRVVKLEDGTVVGRVASMMFSSAHPVYVVDTENGERLVPVVGAFIVSSPADGGDIVVRPIPGLLDAIE